MVQEQQIHTLRRAAQAEWLRSRASPFPIPLQLRLWVSGSDVVVCAKGGALVRVVLVEQRTARAVAAVLAEVRLARGPRHERRRGAGLHGRAAQRREACAGVRRPCCSGGEDVLGRAQRRDELVVAAVEAARRIEELIRRLHLGRDRRRVQELGRVRDERRGNESEGRARGRYALILEIGVDGERAVIGRGHGLDRVLVCARNVPASAGAERAEGREQRAEGAGTKRKQELKSPG